MRRKRIISRKKYVDGMPLFPPTPVEEQYTIYNNDTDELIGTVTSVEEAVNLIQTTGTPKKLVIQNTNTIAANSFENCTNLVSAYLPQEVTSIGNSAFKDSGLKAIALPSNLKSIGSEVFSGSALINITIPETVTTISDTAFSNTNSLQEISLDSHYNEVAGFPWGSDDVLTTYNWLKTTQYEVYDYHTDELLGTYDDLKSAITGINGNTKEVLMVCPYGLTLIDRGPNFENCLLLKRLFLPSTLTRIRIGFGGSGLVIGHIPRSLSGVGVKCFVNCVSLKKAFIGSSSSIWQQCFQNNINLEYAYIDGTFTDADLFNSGTQVPIRIILGKLTEAYTGAFANLNNATIDCPLLTDVQARVIRASSNLVINIGNKLESLSEYAFDGVSDSTINIDLPQDSIAGAPWGATNTTVNWRG